MTTNYDDLLERAFTIEGEPFDLVKGRIVGLFKNYLRIDHLDREAARQAITKPIDRFNETHQSDFSPIAIERELVEAVLDQVKVGEDLLGQGGRGYVATPDGASLGAARIERPISSWY